MQAIASLTKGLPHIAEAASTLEQQGVDILATAELTHDPMIQLALAAGGTSSMGLMTAIRG